MPRTAFTPTSDIRRLSPFRSVDWRWREAGNHRKNHTSPAEWEDPGVSKAYQFQVALSGADTQTKRVDLAQCWPELAAAHAIFILADVERDELEARLICEPVDVIAKKMGISPGVVGAFADTFFDVIDSINALDWMVFQAVGVHRFSLPPKEAECWRYLAFAGGPFVLDLMIADHFGHPDPHYPDRRQEAERARFLVRDHVSLMQTGRWADAEIIEEYCRLYREDVRSGRRKPDPVIALHLKFLRLAAKLPRCLELERSIPKGSLPRRRSHKGNIKEHPAQTMLAMNTATPGIAAGQTCEHGMYPSSQVPAGDQSAGLGINAF